MLGFETITGVGRSTCKNCGPPRNKPLNGFTKNVYNMNHLTNLHSKYERDTVTSNENDFMGNSVQKGISGDTAPSEKWVLLIMNELYLHFFARAR
mgnify:CR=1 FL=1